MSDIGIGEIAVILVIALLVFGPDRLPSMVKQAASFVNDLRKMVANARRDLSDSVGDLGIDEKDWKTLSDLRNPRSFVRQKVLDGADLETFGLDEFQEVGDELELTDGKRRRTANGSGTGSRRSANGAAKTASAKATSAKAGSGSRAGGASTGRARNGEAPVESGAVPDNTSGAVAELPKVAAADTGQATPTGARFDPDAT